MLLNVIIIMTIHQAECCNSNVCDYVRTSNDLLDGIPATNFVLVQ